MVIFLMGCFPLAYIYCTLPVCIDSVQWYAGDNVGEGKDYTLFSTIDGIVIFQKKKDRSKVGGGWSAGVWDAYMRRLHGRRWAVW